jgi:tetratricopeptide (TPR) repeat protein
MSISRGRSTDNFELSIKALEDKDYQSAIEYLKNDIELNPNDKTIFYSYYILGLTHLEMAEKNLLGLFTTFDKSSSEATILNLGKCVKLNTSGNFNNVNLDAFFFMAKASLMLEDSKTAKDYLEIVVKEKGSKMNEAEQILKELK